MNEAPAFTSANSATFIVGTNGSFNVTASGFPAEHHCKAALADEPRLTPGRPPPSPARRNPGTGGIYSLVFTANNGFASNKKPTEALADPELHPHRQRGAGDHERE